jgi:hypothetical protein
MIFRIYFFMRNCAPVTPHEPAANKTPNVNHAVALHE